MEDDPEDVTLLKARLTPDAFLGGFRVTHVETVADAKAKLASHRPSDRFDVVLLDLGLGATTGIDTFHALAEQADRTPIVVLSGDSDRHVALEAVRAGAQDFLVKGQVSTAVLTRVLRHARARAELLDAERVQSRRQRALAELGHRALSSGEPGPVLQAAVEALVAGLGVDRAHVLQRVKNCFRLRAGVGWEQPNAKPVTIEEGRDSWAGYAVLSGEAVAVTDMKSERRFQVGSLLSQRPPAAGS